MRKIALFDAVEGFDQQVRTQVKKMAVLRELFLHSKGFGEAVLEKEAKLLSGGMYEIFDEVISALEYHRDYLEWLHEHEGEEVPEAILRDMLKGERQEEATGEEVSADE